MIKRVTIKGYKSFKDLSLDLKPLTVIFGPNASGKSNFLDALYLVSRFVTRKNLSEAFEGHRGLPLESFYYADEGLQKNLSKPDISFSFEVDVELSDTIITRVEEIVRAKRKGIDSSEQSKKVITEKRLRYCITLQGLPKTGYLRVMDERLCAIKPNGEEKKRFAFIDRRGSQIRLRMEGQAHPTYFNLGLEHTIISEALYEPHYPHITAFRMELANWYTYYLEPKDLMREDVPLAEIENLGSRGQNLAAFLNTLKQKRPKDFDNFNLSLRRILPTEASIDIESLKEGRVLLRLSENGTWYSARLLSEGTLRVIGLLAAIYPKNLATLIAFEEPENGIHPARLKLIAEILKNASQQTEKQIIITTHSPLLPDYFDNQDLFVCFKDNRQTVIKPFTSFGALFKRQDIEHALEDRIVRGDFGG
jgi:predicted ATPase